MLYFSHTKRYTTRGQNKGDNKMTKNTFIKRLSQKADITTEQSRIVVEAIEDHNLFAKDEKEIIIADIAQQLEVDEDTAAKYFSHASQIIRSEIKSQSIKLIAGTAAAVIAGIFVMKMRKNKDKEN